MDAVRDLLPSVQSSPSYNNLSALPSDVALRFHETETFINACLKSLSLGNLLTQDEARLALPDLAVGLSFQNNVSEENPEDWFVVVDQTEMIIDETTGSTSPIQLRTAPFPYADWIIAAKTFLTWASESRIDQIIENLSLA